MSEERDEDLVAAARECDDCLCWLERCEAECCRGFTFRLTLSSDVHFSAGEVHLHTPITPDARRYYELHGARVEGDWITVPRSACRTTLDRLYVQMTCRELRDDNMCGLHTKGKPQVCSDLVLESAHSGEYLLTPRCLFAYKLEAPKAEG